MSYNLLNTLVLAGCYILLFVVGELLYHIFRVKAELTRKLVHMGTGMLALLFPVMLDNHWFVLLLCAAFAWILILSIRHDLLKSIHAIDRKSVGSLVYPVAVYACYLVFICQDKQYIYYYMPILVLAISDPVAGLSGKKWPVGSYRIAGAKKTVLGSGMFFLSAVLVILGCWYFLYSAPQNTGLFMLGVSLTALLATVSEAVSRNGLDNLSIPAAVLLGLFLTKLWLA